MNINQIVAVGSVDGVLTAAALLRAIGNPDVGLVFCQAFTVDKLDLSTWAPNRRVAFVDLAVNNRDKAMTANFVRRVREAGHTIVAVCDEHSREDWLECLGSFDGLLVEPVSQAVSQLKSSTGKICSSGMLLLVAMNSDVPHDTARCLLDEHARVLCHLADEADQMRFLTIGKTINEAVKSRIADDSRRVYLARHFAKNLEPDATINGWVAEYDKILKTHEEILAAKQDLGDGIVRVSAIGKTVDMTTLMSTLYKEGTRVVVLDGEIFDKAAGKKIRQTSFGTSEKLDLLAAIKKVATASGFAQKVNVAPEAEMVALEAVRAVLK